MLSFVPLQLFLSNGCAFIPPRGKRGRAFSIAQPRYLGSVAAHAFFMLRQYIALLAFPMYSSKP